MSIFLLAGTLLGDAISERLPPVRPSSPASANELFGSLSGGRKKAKRRVTMVKPQSSRTTSPSCLQSENVKLKPHQSSVSKHLRNNRGLIALHSTGTGKTLTAAAASRCMLEGKLVDHVVFVVKKSTVSTIVRELERFWPKAPKKEKYSFVTWEKLTMAPGELPPASKALTIVDEAHLMRNVKSSHPGFRYVRESRRVLLLTATAVVNEQYDMAPLLAAVRGGSIPTKRRFLADMDANFGKLFRGAVSVNITNQQASPDFPTKHVHTVSIPMGPKTLQRYKQQEKLQSAFEHSLRELSLGYDGECGKCQWLLRNVQRWIDGGEGKIVVYAQFLENGGARLQRLFAEAGIRSFIIDGSTPATQRRDIVARFNEPLTDGERKSREVVDFEKGDGTRCGESMVVARTLLNPDASPADEPKYRYDPPGDEKAIAYAESLRIPRYPYVEVCPPNPKLLYVAKDGSGKWQHRYSEEWHVQQELEKLKRLRHMDDDFWKRLDKKVGADLERESTSEMALAVRVLRKCLFRPGWKEVDDGDSDESDESDDESDGGIGGGMAHGCFVGIGGGADSDSDDSDESDDSDDEEDEDHFGLTTLLNRHVRCGSASCQFEFVGKSGMTNTCTVARADDPSLSRRLRSQRDKGGPDDRLFDVTAKELSDYLRPFPIRAKDFRTFYANERFVQILSAHPDPVGATMAERRKVVRDALLTVSKALNNRPETTKRSYVFTGMYVLFLTAPSLFVEKVEAAPSARPADVVTHLIGEFADDRIDWRDLVAQFKDAPGVGYLDGDLNVLCITDAGSEGIDLRGVRHIVFSDIPWTEMREAQVEGRGQRFRSHAHLPRRERRVDVWKLSLDLPSSEGRKSIDRRNLELIEEKRRMREGFYRRLGRVSV